MEEEESCEAATDDESTFRLYILTPPEDDRWTPWELEMGFDN
jgi:hypothetical protein